MCLTFYCLIAKDKSCIVTTKPNILKHENPIDFVFVEIDRPNANSWDIKLSEISIPIWYANDRHDYEKLLVNACVGWEKESYSEECYRVDVLSRQSVLMFRGYYKDGEYHSPDENTPATQGWNNSGVLIYQQYWKDGKFISDKKLQK